MKSFVENVKMRFPVEANREAARPSCLVVGKTGVGKTTIVNKICQTNFAATQGSNSVTRDLKVGKVSRGKNSFDLIDSPGTDSSKDAFAHIYLLYTGLTCRPHNTIFVVIQFNSRYEKMVDDFLPIEAALGKEYIDKIVIIVSKFDQVDNEKQAFNEICQEFSDYQNNILFFSNKTSDDEIANAMFAVASRMHRTKIDIKENEFLANFNLCSLKNMTKDFINFEKKARELYQMFKEAISERPTGNSRETDEFLHFLLVEFKQATDELYEESYKQRQNLMADLNYYAYAINLQKTLLQYNDKFKDDVTPLMSYDIFDRSDPTNWFKRCPNCGLMWMKIDACSNTTCGNRGWPTIFDIIAKPFWKFTLSRIGGKLRWFKNEKSAQKIENNVLVTDKGKIVSQTIKYKKTNFINNFKIAINKDGYVGCGAQMKFDLLPPVEKTTIDEMLMVKSKQEIYEMMEKEEFATKKEEQKKDLLSERVDKELIK